MAGFFPNPYKDELFYSICARYADYVQYLGRDSVQIDLFGRRNITSVIELPTYLGSFIKNLPPGNELTASRLIDEHTLLPFHSPFLPAARVRQVKKKMVYPNKGSALRASGINRHQVCNLDFLRFCPRCVVEDRELYGECFWHRSHQIPGINVCHRHSLFLEHSRVRIRNEPSSVSFVSAERVVLEVSPHILNSADEEQQTLLNLAHDCFWLLGQYALSPGFKVLHGAYATLLNAQGIATAIGVVRISMLQDALRRYYSSTFLAKIGCDFDERQSTNWPSRFVKDLSSGKTHHPLQHLLMIRLLGHSAESFFSICATRKPKALSLDRAFGKGPWPCLNPVCKYYRKLVIKTCKITSSSYRDHKPVGNFECTCGFIYTRNGPDSSPESRFKLARIKYYGATWNFKLESMWRDSSICLKQMARVLNIKSSTLKFRAALLGLPFPRVSTRGQVIRKTPDVKEWLKRNKCTRPKTVDPKKKGKYRKLWLSTIDKYPHISRKELHRLSRGSYHWLYKYDKAWLTQNSPSPRKRGCPFLDWIGLDNQLSSQVVLIANNLKLKPGRPVRITKAAIAHDLGGRRYLLNKSEKVLPKTAHALSQALETLTDFYCRKLTWAADCFKLECVFPSVTALAKRATIKWGKWYIPEIETAITTTRDSLKEYFEMRRSAVA